MAAYSASRNSVDLAIDPLITCRLCLVECSLQDMYELRDCKCLYCEKVSIVHNNYNMQLFLESGISEISRYFISYFVWNYIIMNMYNKMIFGIDNSHIFHSFLCQISNWAK